MSYEFFFNSIEQFLFIISKKGEILKANEYVIRKLDYSMSELKRVNFLDLLELEGTINNPIISTIIQEDRDSFECVLRGKDKITYPISIKIQKGSWSDKEIFYCIGKDRTLEEEIEKIKANVYAILDNVPEYIWLKDLEGNYLMVNKAIEDHSGLPSSEIIGKNDKDFFDENIVQQMRKNDLMVIKSKKPTILEQQVMIEEQKTYYEVSINPVIDKKNRVIALTGITKDITKEKENELEKIKATKESERANQIKSQLLGYLSHELRTPMNGLIGFIELFSKTDINSEQEYYINQVKKVIDSLNYLLNDLKDITLIESKQLKIEHNVVDIYELIYDTLESFRIQLKKKNIKLELKVGKEVPKYICTDPIRLKQVLNNIISNAIKYTTEGTIYVRVIKKSDNDHLETFSFKVIDTGEGIHKEILPQIFDPFVKDSKKSGLGLGLNIAKEIVKLLNGEIKVRSSVNRGSVFTVTLKTKKINQDTIHSNHKATQGEISIEKNKYQLLLVEDVLFNQKLQRKMLEKLGYTVEIANNGKEAIQMCSENVYDLVLMDCQMPIIDGYEATKIIKSILGLEDIIIIAMSANVFEEDIKKCYAVGMDDFISKPVRMDQLDKTIKKWLKTKQDT
ncbi:PAS domain S-box-containing protein [Natranaerovirga hydrolytica]|uniref:Stage 0 sporulation protein A homolog n=1 Tax=Natranaerovirga hydrolytica TaxID=680378 RepID=A0A4R1MLP3_9FIRM|nr:ATP-binding protein [Natranaerovirga hydrolytica]TCK92782.1 PAS domain S-box-containing protein [Natranaerovirga hydrolytica]